jgi:hypothetical protein
MLKKIVVRIVGLVASAFFFFNGVVAFYRFKTGYGIPLTAQDWLISSVTMFVVGVGVVMATVLLVKKIR